MSNEIILSIAPSLCKYWKVGLKILYIYPFYYQPSPPQICGAIVEEYYMIGWSPSAYTISPMILYCRYFCSHETILIQTRHSGFWRALHTIYMRPIHQGYSIWIKHNTLMLFIPDDWLLQSVYHIHKWHWLKLVLHVTYSYIKRKKMAITRQPNATVGANPNVTKFSKEQNDLKMKDLK